MRYYHAKCRKCEWGIINKSVEYAEKKGLEHYYNTPEEGHHIHFFDTTVRLAKEDLRWDTVFIDD